MTNLFGNRILIFIGIIMTYRITIEKGEDFGFIAHCPAIPGCHSQGKTIEEAIENIKDAIKGCLENTLFR